MKIKSAKGMVLIATILVGYLIVINFNFDRKQAAFQLNASEYKNSLQEKNKLLSEVNSLSEDNRKITNKIGSYDIGGDKQNRIIQDMKSQLSDYGMLSGLNEVKGPGVVIRVSDGEINHQEDSDYEKLNKIFHDKDLQLLLNEIRLSGAEAISINDRRITAYTGAKCHWASILFEDYTEVYPVFNFYVIGDPKTLEAGLMADGSYLQRLKTRGLGISLEKKDEIILKAADIRSFNYAEEYVNKK